MPRIVLVGCGLWGTNILRVLVRLKTDVVVVELNAERRDQALQQGATESLDTLDKVHDNIDGFVVATPATTHFKVVKEILSFGKPVFVEKPFTTDARDAEKLAAAGAGRLFVMDIWRYHPGICALAQIAASKELGAVEMLRSTRTNWTSPRRDTDAIWTLLPHDLAITLEIFEGIPEPTFAFAEPRNDSLAGMLAVLGEAPRVIIEVSTRYADKRREVRLHCREGVAVFNALGQPQIEIFREQGGGEPATSVRAFSSEEPLEIELRAFLDHLSGGPPPRSSAEEGLEIVQTIAAVRRLAGVD